MDRLIELIRKNCDLADLSNCPNMKFFIEEEIEQMENENEKRKEQIDGLDRAMQSSLSGKRLPESEEIVATRIKEISDGETLPAVQNPLQIAADMVRRGASEKEMGIIEKMMEFDERQRAQAREQLHFAAMARFNEAVPPITKDKLNKHFKSKYSSIENTLNTCRPHLAAQGLYVTFNSPIQTKEDMTLSIVVSHAEGHRETVTMTIPIVSPPVGKTSGQSAMNPTQAIKATFTYLRGALLEAALGTAGTDATLNNDGNTAGDPEEKINDAQHADIITLLQELGKNEKTYCTFKKVESLSDLPASKFESIIKELQGWRK